MCKYYESETDRDIELHTDSGFFVIKVRLYTENKKTIGSLHGVLTLMLILNTCFSVLWSAAGTMSWFYVQ